MDQSREIGRPGIGRPEIGAAEIGLPEISVDTASAVAPYEQIRSQLDELIRSGRLGAGQRLPPVRQLAVDLGLAAGTVARAYRELEVTGRVETRRGAGTTVVGRARPVPSLDQLAATYVHDGRSLGHTDRDLIRALQHVLLRDPVL